MNHIAPVFVSITFIFTTLLTLFFFYKILKEAISKRSNLILIGGLIIWLALQATLAYLGVYSTDLNALPPKFPFVVFPPIFVIAYLLISSKGKVFIDKLSLLKITWLNVVRIPVEITLYWLFLYKTVPELMTFSGRNFDILAGITAPFIAYFGIAKKMMGRTFLLTWNIVALSLLLFIVFNAILSAPFTFQQFAFDQPNKAVLHFPYIWLPTFIVPIVLFGHLVSIRRLWSNHPT